jgi:rhodanese-related sulfurtransferase
MNRIFSVAMAASIAFLSACAGSGSRAQGTQSAQITKDLGVTAYAQKLSATPGAQLVDVRSSEEYAGGHLKGSVNIDYQASDFEAKVANVDRSKPVFLYCHSGRRSAAAAAKMEEMGFKVIYNLSGGISEWEKEHMPIE